MTHLLAEGEVIECRICWINGQSMAVDAERYAGWQRCGGGAAVNGAGQVDDR